MEKIVNNDQFQQQLYRLIVNLTPFRVIWPPHIILVAVDGERFSHSRVINTLEQRYIE